MIIRNLDKTEFPLYYYKACLPLVHIMFGIIKPHSNLDGVAFTYPMKNILHLEIIFFKMSFDLQIISNIHFWALRLQVLQFGLKMDTKITSPIEIS